MKQNLIYVSIRSGEITVNIQKGCEKEIHIYVAFLNTISHLTLAAINFVKMNEQRLALTEANGWNISVNN